MKDKNRIIIFDTTMRDGEQSPGASMSLEEKLQISRVFDELAAADVRFCRDRFVRAHKFCKPNMPAMALFTLAFLT